MPIRSFGSDRRAVLAVLGWLVGAPALGVAAPTDRRRLGVLLFDGEAAWGFLRRDLPAALARLDWHEGRNLVILWRFADGDTARLAPLARQLLRDGVDVLLTRGTPATRALQQATRIIPIVTGVGDPVGAGFARTLAAPGGNITGLSYALVEQAQKQIELLRAMVPSARHLLILLHANRAPRSGETVELVDQIARTQGLQPQLVLADRAEQVQRAAAAARRQHPAGSVVAYAFSFGTDTELALAAQQERIPTVFDRRAYVDAGGLLSYQLFWDDQTQRTAAQLDKVMRGAPASSMPFEQPTRTELVINGRTARMMGLTIAPDLLARADEVLP